MEGDVSSSQLSLRDEFSSDLLAKNSFEGRSREFSELWVLCSNGARRYGEWKKNLSWKVIVFY